MEPIIDKQRSLQYNFSFFCDLVVLLHSLTGVFKGSSQLIEPNFSEAINYPIFDDVTDRLIAEY